MLKSVSTISGKYTNSVDNQRGHVITSDLGPQFNGDDKGATPLELVVMAVSSCTTTIFKLMAEKMQLNVEELSAEVEAEKPEPMGSITEVRTTVRVKSSSPEEDLNRVLDLVKKNCPVGVLLSKAEIPHEYTLQKI
jgi:uncharacterized OsmC-like protein